MLVLATICICLDSHTLQCIENAQDSNEPSAEDVVASARSDANVDEADSSARRSVDNSVGVGANAEEGVEVDDENTSLNSVDTDCDDEDTSSEYDPGSDDDGTFVLYLICQRYTCCMSVDGHTVCD